MSEIDEIDCQTVSRSGPSKPREGAEGRQAPDQKRPSAAGAEPTARPASVFHWREPVPQSPFHSPRPHGFPATATTATTRLRTPDLDRTAGSQLAFAVSSEVWVAHGARSGAGAPPPRAPGARCTHAPSRCHAAASSGPPHHPRPAAGSPHQQSTRCVKQSSDALSGHEQCCHTRRWNGCEKVPAAYSDSTSAFSCPQSTPSGSRRRLPLPPVSISRAETICPPAMAS